MRIIPVLDIKGGKVVRARKGERASYAPIETPLSATPEIADVARGLRRIHPFTAFYVADLDAIEGRTPNHDAAAELRRAVPDAEVWLDAGFADEETVERALAQPATRVVIGSESQTDQALLARYGSHPNVLLSLDFRGEDFQGPCSILADPDLWPNYVIVMTLARVGSGQGPDLQRLRMVKDCAAGRLVVAAGGVRGEDDILALEKIGINSVLVATALHDGALTPEFLGRHAR